jgi:hypothetical protein
MVCVQCSTLDESKIFLHSRIYEVSGFVVRFDVLKFSENVFVLIKKTPNARTDGLAPDNKVKADARFLGSVHKSGRFCRKPGGIAAPLSYKKTKMARTAGIRGNEAWGMPQWREVAARTKARLS